MDWKEVLGETAIAQLLANHKEQQPRRGTREERDYQPVCKLFLPWTSGTWLITECDETGLAFGLADLGYPEMGYISLDELLEIHGPGGLRVERDIHFRAGQTLSQYADDARRVGYIAV